MMPSELQLSRQTTAKQALPFSTRRASALKARPQGRIGLKMGPKITYEKRTHSYRHNIDNGCSYLCGSTERIQAEQIRHKRRRDLGLGKIDYPGIQGQAG